MPHSQKDEINKGLVGYEDCKALLDEAYRDRGIAELKLDIEKELNDGYKVENTELLKENVILLKTNKTLKSNVVLWKLLGLGSGIIGFYLGTKS